MTEPLRVVDTGTRPARWNVAMTAALAELHAAGSIPDTIRFHRYAPCVLIGRHQNPVDAVSSDVCAQRGITIARRVTGGGSVFMDPGVLAWDAVLGRESCGANVREVAATVCTAVAAGLSRLGLPARYRPPGDVEVSGKKVSGAGGYFERATCVCQGTVLIDCDFAVMVDVLAMPGCMDRGEMLANLSRRTTTVADLLGRVPEAGEVEEALTAGLALRLRRTAMHDVLADDERALADVLLAREYGTETFVSGENAAAVGATCIGRHSAAHGTVEAHVRLLPGRERRIDQLWITGEAGAALPRPTPDLEAALRGVPLADAPGRAAALISRRSVDMLDVDAPGIVAAIAAAQAEASARQTSR